MNNKILYIAFVLAMAPALSRAQAQTVADSTAAQQVHVAFGKVNKSDLLGGVNEVNVADLLKKDYHAYSLDGRQFTTVGTPFEMRSGNWKGIRIGLYCYGEDGKAQFDDFKYQILR